MRYRLTLFLTATLVSSSVSASEMSCAFVAGGKPVAVQWGISDVSRATVARLRQVVTDTFTNSDQVLKQYLSNSATIGKISAFGSDRSASSYGIYNALLKRTGKDGILKLPLRYSIETLMAYFYQDIQALPDTSDPMDFWDGSPRAIEQRRAAGIAILVQHVFKAIEQEVGFKITADVLAAYSRRDVNDLIKRFPDMKFREDEQSRSTYQNLPPIDQPDAAVPVESIPDPRDLISYGILYEKLNIVLEQKGEDMPDSAGRLKSAEDRFGAVPGVKSQVLVLAWLLTQLGIELPDPSPVLTANGRVNLIDLDEVIVAIHNRGKLTVIANIAPDKIDFYRKEYLAGRWLNQGLLMRAGMTIEDLLRSTQVPR